MPDATNKPKKSKQSKQSKRSPRFAADFGTGDRVAVEVVWTGGELALDQGEARAVVCNALPADGQMIVGATLLLSTNVAVDRQRIIEQFGAVVAEE